MQRIDRSNDADGDTEGEYNIKMKANKKVDHDPQMFCMKYASYKTQEKT